MGLLILLAFIGVPLVEIALFIQVGGWIGLVPTLVVVVATAVAGTALLRAQGLSTLRRAQASLDRGAFPAEALFDGLCLLVAGALLLTPGFATDVSGLLLFMPSVRLWLRRRLLTRLAASGHIHVAGFGARTDQGPAAGEGAVIDGDYEDLTSTDDDGQGGGNPPDAPRPTLGRRL